MVEALEPWADAVDILREMAAPPFTGDDVPACLGDFACAYARATGFDASLTITAAVSIAAAALNDRIQVCADANTEWFQQARLWMLAIGRPAAGKTPAQRKMAEPLWEIQRELREAYAKECAALGEEEDKPPMPRVVLSDTTVEALSEVLRANPRGILIANDEFEGWLGSLDTYRRGAVSRDRGEWLRAFDGGPHTVERVNRGSVFVPNWGASILSATTPAALAKMMRNLPEDGLLQRFICVLAGGRTDTQHVDGMPGLREAYALTIRRLYAVSPKAHNGIVPLHWEAQQFLQGWLRQQRLESEAFGALDSALESHIAKYPTFLLRLALTFHVAGVVNFEHEQSRDPAAWPITVETMQTAAAFLKRAQKHALASYLSRSGGSEAYEVAREVARAILAKVWVSVARRDLLSTVRAFRNAEPGVQTAALQLLVDAAWVRPLPGPYNKATPAHYEVNPGLSVRFQALAEQERERRQIVRNAISDAAAVRRSEVTP